MINMRKVAYFISTAILAGCGGGGSEPTSPAPSVVSTPKTYTVTVNVGNGATVPNSSYTVSDGEKLSFNINVNENFEIDGVSGCNGSLSGLTYTTSAISNNCSVSVTVKDKPYFVEVKNAFDVPNPFTQTSATVVTTLDINNDNLEDLVVHFWSGEFAGKKVFTPCPNQLKVFVLQPDKSFKDMTSTYIQGSNDLGGCSRKVKKADVNKDGKLDLLYAVNQEEGREIVITEFHRSSNADAQLAALVSVGNTYVIRKFNTPRWYHSVGAGVDKNNNYYITGEGYTGGANRREDSIDKNGNVSEIDIDIPRVSPGTFELYNSAGNNSESTLLIQNLSIHDPSIAADIEGYVKKNGSWVTLQNYSPIGKPLGKFKDSEFYAFKMDNKFITGVSYAESCMTQLNPNGSPTSIFKMHYNVMNESFVDGMSIGNNISTPSSRYMAFRIENEKVVEVPLNIKNEVRDNVNINFFDCKDVTGDGYNDIVSYSYSNDGLPHVYANNKDNSFTYLGQKMFPDTYTQEFGNVYSTVLHDFDKDGFMDIVFWPANGVKTTGNLKFKFYRGQRKLN